MLRFLAILCFCCCFLACAEQEEPEATKILKAMQGAAPASANASGKILMSWNEPIDSKKFGLAPNPKVDGKTIAQILTSQVAGRDDGQLCSACHNSGDAQGDYGVNVAKNAANPEMKPTDIVYGKTWVQKGGWAEGFVANPTKPANVKAVIQAWIDNGYK